MPRENLEQEQVGRIVDKAYNTGFGHGMLLMVIAGISIAIVVLSLSGG